MRLLRMLALLALAALAVAPATAAPDLSPAPLSPTVIRRLDRFELHMRLPAGANPFDPDQILVRGHFLSPSGRAVNVDGFYYQEFTRRREQLTDQVYREVLSARGQPEWRIRFTPTEIGTWAYTVSVRDASGQRTSVLKTFRVVQELRGKPDFVRPLGRYFVDPAGHPYFPVGENLAWAGTQGTFSYDLWMGNLARQGANYARIWLGPFDLFTFERKLGRYDLEAAWRLDHVLDLAERSGIRLSLCAESFNALRIRPGPALWKANPYNVKRGGFLTRPAQFFVDASARRMFKNRLRYLAARYGYSPNVFSWELMNEVDLTEDFSVEPVRAWHEEMARALRSFDPNHMITTSFGATEGEAAIDALPEIDYIQTHLYGAGDLAQAIAQVCRDKARRYAKPNLVSEAAASVHRSTVETDDAGIWLHDALWAPIFAGGAGGGSPWFWESYVQAKARYAEFGAVARFTLDVPWVAYDWKPLDVMSTRYESAQKLARNDLIIAPVQAGWQPAPYNRPVTVEVLRDGTVRDAARLSRLLHGVRHPQIHNPATFLVDYPVDGQFLVHVLDPPSAQSVLRVALDGTTVLEEGFSGRKGGAGQSFSIRVTAGQHAIQVDNAGSGWIDVDYELPGYRRGDRPNLRVGGLCSDRYALVWIENRDHTWLRRALKKAVRPVAPSLVVLRGFQIGDYVVEEWNTRTGASIPYEQRCVDGHITLRVPVLPADIAFKVRAK